MTNERLGVVEETLKNLAAQQLMLTRYVGNERVGRLEAKVGA